MQAVPGTGDKVVNKTNRCPSLHGVFMGVRGEKNNQVIDIGIMIFVKEKYMKQKGNRMLGGGKVNKKGGLKSAIGWFTVSFRF